MDHVLCQYCGERNDAEELRCTRCRRRLHRAEPRPAPEFYPAPTVAAAIPALEVLPGRNAIPSEAAAAPQTAPSQSQFQRSLFVESPLSPKVIPIPTLTPLRPAPRESSPVRQVAPRSAGARTPVRQRRGLDSQQALQFHAPVDTEIATQVEVIYCDAPVALPTHRAMAAAVDLSMIMISLGIFLGIFYAFGGDMSLSKQSAPFLGALAFVIATFYRFLWCLGNGDTPGMRFAGLKLVDFDGRVPDRDQRLLRQVASILSILSAGLGLVWALVDEENLTWHDHISKTFPTPGR